MTFILYFLLNGNPPKIRVSLYIYYLLFILFIIRSSINNDFFISFSLAFSDLRTPLTRSDVKFYLTTPVRSDSSYKVTPVHSVLNFLTSPVSHDVYRSPSEKVLSPSLGILSTCHVRVTLQESLCPSDLTDSVPLGPFSFVFPSPSPSHVTSVSGDS